MTSRLSLIATLILGAAGAGCASAGPPPDGGTQDSGRYRVVFDASVRQVDGGEVEVLSRDTAWLAVAARGDSAFATWTPFVSSEPERRLRGTREGQNLRLKGPPGVHTFVDRTCGDPDDPTSCTATERRESVTQEYTLRVNDQIITGTIATVNDAGAALGPVMKLEGRRHH